jgi:UDP-glucose 4-epimerase
VLELANLLAELAGTRLDASHAPPRAGEIRHSTGSPEHARQVLGLAAPVSLRAGLSKVLDWMRASG